MYFFVNLQAIIYKRQFCSNLAYFDSDNFMELLRVRAEFKPQS